MAQRRRARRGRARCAAIAAAAVLLYTAVASAALNSVEPGWSGDYFQLRLELASPAHFQVWRTETPAKVVVDLAAPAEASVPHRIEVGDSVVERVRVAPGPLGTRVVIDLKTSLPPPQVEQFGPTLTLSLPARFRTHTEVPFAPGVSVGTIRAREGFGPISVKYLRVDLNQPGVRVLPGLPGESFARETVRQIAHVSGAIGGVNGGYFDWAGRPLGLLVVDGELVSESIYGRTAFAVTEEGAPFIGPIESRAWIETPSGERIPLDGVNRVRAQGEAVAYTPRYGRLPLPSGERVSLARGVVAEFERLDPELREALEGAELKFALVVDGEEADGIRWAIGGGPRLLRDGRIEITGREERFLPDVLNGRAPRTAVGITPSGEVLLVVADGRRAQESVGLTLEELAQLMLDLGAVEAMNLDGGGSTTLVVDGMLLNNPSDGRERHVASALLVYAPR